MAVAFGIDVGGSGIKGAPVDLIEGKFLTPRLRIPTPPSATPQQVAEICGEILRQRNVGPDTPVGITLPAPVKNDRVLFMANLDQSWAGVEVNELFARELGRPVHAINDADAAGYAEVSYGAARDVPGLVIVTTLGTGIGSAFIQDGLLIQNTELGHLELDGRDAESWASSGVQERDNLSWEVWAERLQRYYRHLEMLFSPDLFVVGGGVSSDAEHYLPLLRLRTPIVPAALLNTAGIVGAAAWAAEQK